MSRLLSGKRRARHGLWLRRWRTWLAVGSAGLIMAASCVVVGTTVAMSTANVGNGVNSLQTGQMTLTDDDSGSALYTLSGYLDAGQQLPTKCIAVTYNGNWADQSFDGGPLTSWDTDKFTSNRPEDVTVSGGQMGIATTTDTRVSLLNSSWGLGFDMRHANYQVQLLGYSGAGQAELEMWSDDNAIEIVAYSTKLSFNIYSDGHHYASEVDYDLNLTKFIRVSGRGQELRLQYSADAVVWTTALSHVVSFPLSNVILAVRVVLWEGGTGSASGAFKDFKVTPNVGVRLTANPTGDLAPYLNMTVERGTGGGFGSCAGFTPQATVYSGTLAAMPTTYSDAAAAAGEWNPSTASETVTYRISGYVTDAQVIAGKTASATFTWAAHAGD